MKKILTLSSALLCSAVIFSSTAFAENLLPVRKTLEERGYTISWDNDNKSVIIEKGDFKCIEPVGEKISLEGNTTYAAEEFFNEIEAASNVQTEPKLSMTATVKDINIKEGYILAANEARGDIMFRFDDKTNFHHEKNKMFYTAADIVVGMELEFCHNEAMTMSLPPQTYAYEIIFHDNEAKPFMTATVKEIGEGYILAETKDMGEIMFRFDEKTNFHHEKNKMFYTVSDVAVGMELRFYHEEAMTKSLPPQTYASEIVFFEADTTDAMIAIPVAMITTATVKEVGEGYILAESEEKGEIMFLVDESTHFHHEKNKMFYTVSDVEVGAVLDFIHDDVMTLSLPPQIYAREVIFH